jgi:hypothetical protein
LGVSPDGAAGVGGAAGMKKEGRAQTEDYVRGELEVRQREGREAGEGGRDDVR